MDDTLAVIAIITGGVVGFIVAVLLATVIGGVALRIAAVILGFGDLRYLTAFKAALLANFVMLVLQFAAGFQYGWAAMYSRMQLERWGYPGSGRMYNGGIYEMAFSFTPTFYLLAVMFGLVTTALIFCRMLPTDKDGRLMNFRDALTLAAVYQAISFAILILIGLFVFTLIILLMMT